jgi:hypothetical protein
MVGQVDGTKYGAAYNAKWIAARISDNPDDGERTQSILDCLDWVLAMPSQYLPDVINCSFHDFTIDNCSDLFIEKLDSIEQRGIAIVFAVGNGNFYSPQSYVGTETLPFTVGGLSGVNYDIAATSSTKGYSPCLIPADPSSIKPEVYAPMENIDVFNNNGSIQPVTGTSYASPLVAGGVALLKEARPSLSGKQILEVLMETAQDKGTQGNDPVWGWGIVDFWEAYKSIVPVYASFQNLRLEGSQKLNLDGSYLLVDNGENVQRLPSPTQNVEFYKRVLIIEPENEIESSYRFYQWDDNSSREIVREDELDESVINEFETNFAPYKPLTLRNSLEGVVEDGTIWFGETGEEALPGDFTDRVAGYTGNTYKYDQEDVPIEYKAQAIPSQFNGYDNTTWEFAGWSDGSTDNPHTFPVTASTPSTITAKYKGHMRSDNDGALRGISQRKAARLNDGTTYVAYESQGKVWLEAKPASGSWHIVTPSAIALPLSENDSKLPAVAALGSDAVVVFQRKNGSYSDIVVNHYNSGSFTPTQQVITTTMLYSFSMVPVVAFSDNSEVMVVIIKGKMKMTKKILTIA